MQFLPLLTVQAISTLMTTERSISYMTFGIHFGFYGSASVGSLMWYHIIFVCSIRMVFVLEGAVNIAYYIEVS